jgi:hypothetical protein
MRLLNCIKNIIKEERIGKLFGDIKVKVSIETSSHGNTQRFRHGKDEVISNDEILNVLNLGLPEILDGIKEGELGQDSSIVVSQKDYPFLNVVTNLEEQDCYNFQINIVTTIRKKRFYTTGKNDFQIYV